MLPLPPPLMALLRTFLLVSFCTISLLLLAGPCLLRAATTPTRLRLEAQARSLSLPVGSRTGSNVAGAVLLSGLPRR